MTVLDVSLNFLIKRRLLISLRMVARPYPSSRYSLAFLNYKKDS